MIYCRFERKLFSNPVNGYTVGIYKTREQEKVPQSAVREEHGGWTTFTAVGTELPDIEETEFEMEGEWKDTPRFGRQLMVEWFRVILPKSREGIIGYLSSGMIKGIGPATAKRIADQFGAETFQVLDNHPERLLLIRGITREKLEEIKKSYADSQELRELMTFLAPFQVTPKKAERIQEHFGAGAAKIVAEQPYRLCEIRGFGFLTVDPIARASRGFAPWDTERIKAANQFVLQDAEKEGHLYLDSRVIIDRAYNLLNQGFEENTVKRDTIIRAGNEMVLEDETLQSDGSAVFLRENREAERKTAYHILRLLMASAGAFDIEQELEEAQAETGIVLAEKQKESVRKTFRYPVSIITGGPGKGKTTVLRIILRIFEQIEKGKEVLLCAPTGRARKRMAESTGYPALTIHKALYLKAEDEEKDGEEELLEADFMIADEFTMADMRLASILFSRIKSGTRVVLVGDVDQIPSVGPGNVFKELIDSGIIPVTELDVFFRQAKDSRIILNADRINRNQRKLLYGDDFQFVNAADDTEAAELVGEIYQKELKAHGYDPDTVQVLSPLRVNTRVGVNALNQRLQDIANPSSLEKAEWQTAGGRFRYGDKVMQTKNTEEISNGDVGKVVDIWKDADGTMKLKVDFGDAQKTYGEEDLNHLDHAYATSIHKSQGAEYPVVIIPVLTCFYPMLKRNIYYTGITRAKKRVYLIGSRKALAIAVGNSDVEKRNTLLASRIRSEAQRVGYVSGKRAA